MRYKALIDGMNLAINEDKKSILLDRNIDYYENILDEIKMSKLIDYKRIANLILVYFDDKVILEIKEI